ncbi:putative transcription factor Znf-LSD family [Helianthus debilis subsp. tardiflorus]
MISMIITPCIILFIFIIVSLGMEMDQLICGGCRTLLMYTRGATSVRCSCCHTVNLAPVANQLAQVNCGNCRTTLMYPYGAPSVKCAMSNGRIPVPVRPNGTATSGSMPPVSTVSSCFFPFYAKLTEYRLKMRKQHMFDFDHVFGHRLLF